MKVKCIIIILSVFVILSSNVYALSDIFSDAEGFITTGQAHTDGTIDTTQLQNASDEIYNTFLAIGTVIAVIVGAILGIQFMTAGIDSKVKVKESLVAYVVSCIVLFGAFGIWKLVVIIMGQI